MALGGLWMFQGGYFYEHTFGIQNKFKLEILRVGEQVKRDGWSKFPGNFIIVSRSNEDNVQPCDIFFSVPDTKWDSQMAYNNFEEFVHFLKGENQLKQNSPVTLRLWRAPQSIIASLQSYLDGKESIEVVPSQKELSAQV